MLPLPPPQIHEGSTNLLTPGRARPFGVMHKEVAAAGQTIAEERLVLFDRAPFDQGESFRARRATDPALHQPWRAAEPALRALGPVAAFARMRCESKPAPDVAVDLGERGRFMTFTLRVGRTWNSLADAGGLLRIDHEDGTFTDHWALWDGWRDVDADWRMEAERVPDAVKGRGGGFTSLVDFLTFHLADPSRFRAAPRQGSWVRASRYRVISGV